MKRNLCEREQSVKPILKKTFKIFLSLIFLQYSYTIVWNIKRLTMKSRLNIIFLSSFILFAFSCSDSNTRKTVSEKGAENFSHLNLKTDNSGLSTAFATIKTVHGDIVFRFYAQKAPVTSKRIIHLIQTGFYNGLTFHRVIPNFIIQTGDPTGSGAGGSGVKLPLEPNDIQHIKGTIGIARSMDPKSGDSQFYISLTTLPHLDHKYTVFGQVIEGLEILPKISKGDKILSIELDLNIKNQ